MTITLGGIELSDLVFENEFDTKMESVVETALDGTPNIWEQNIQSRDIDLIGGDDYGWLSRNVLEQLFSIASVPGVCYTLSYEGTEYTVRFRNEDLPVISAEPTIARPNQEGSDFYKNVRIKLMEIS